LIHVLCSLKETCNIYDEQEKILKSSIEQLKQEHHRTEYVKSIYCVTDLTYRTALYCLGYFYKETSLLWRNVYVEQSISSVFCPFFYTCQVLNTIASYEYQNKMLSYRWETALQGVL